MYKSFFDIQLGFLAIGILGILFKYSNDFAVKIMKEIAKDLKEDDLKKIVDFITENASKCGRLFIPRLKVMACSAKWTFLKPRL